MAFGGYKSARKLIFVAVFLAVLIFSNWILAPFIWSPSIDDIDIDLVTKETDALFSKCKNEGYINESSFVYIRVEPTSSPYIFRLHARGRDWIEFGFFCSEVIHIPMWNDWWTFYAGLHVVQDGGKFPFNSDQSMSNIGGRVYRWNNYGKSVWATR